MKMLKSQNKLEKIHYYEFFTYQLISDNLYLEIGLINTCRQIFTEAYF